MSELAIMPMSDYKGICDAIREGTNTTELIKSGEAAGMIQSIADVSDDIITRALTEYSNARIAAVGRHAFYYCEQLTTVDLPRVLDVGAQAFYYCSQLTTVNLPMAQTIRDGAFYYCTKLPAIDLPLATTIEEDVFSYCTQLTTVNFPLTTSVGNYAFRGCTQLTTVNLPMAQTIGNGAFYYCSALTAADFPLATSIGTSAFKTCKALKSLCLRNTETVCALGDKEMFKETPGGFKIYVPSALIDSYKAATNWSVWASYFRALEDYTVDGTVTGALDLNKI